MSLSTKPLLHASSPKLARWPAGPLARFLFSLLITTLFITPRATRASTNNDLRDLLKQGRHEELLRRCQDRLEQQASQNNNQQLLFLRASALQALGYIKQAKQTLTSLQNNNSQSLQMAIHTILAMTIGASDRTNALQHLDQAEALANTLQDRPAIAGIRLNRANLLALNNEYDKALTEYQHVLRLPDIEPATEGVAQINAAIIAARRGQADLATQWLREASKTATSLPQENTTRQLLQTIAYQAQHMKQHRLAKEMATEALALAHRLKQNRGRSEAAGLLGQLAEAEGDLATALRYTRQALFMAQQCTSFELLYQWNWQLGRLHRAQNHNNQAQHALEAAVEALDPIRHDLAVALWNQKKSYRDTVGPLYFELADLYLQSNDSQRLHDARQLIERFKSHELEDYFQDECVNLAQKKVVSLDKLSPNIAALYIIPLPDRTELLLGIGTTLHRVTSSIRAEELRNTRHSFSPKPRNTNHPPLPQTSKTTVYPSHSTA